MNRIVLSPRTRLLSVRVTREEHEKLRDIAATCGARCLSDFARDALLQAAHGPAAGAEPCAPAIAASAFEERLQVVEARLELLTKHFESAAVPDRSNSAEKSD